MTSFDLLAVALAILPLFGLSLWIWLATVRESEILLAFPSPADYSLTFMA
jgi:hypothetical protein